VGGVLLLWAALKAGLRRKLIAWVFAGAIVLLFGSQALAVVTGLASGEIEAVGLPWILVLAGLAGYALALIVLGVAGVLWVRDLLHREEKAGGLPGPGM